MRLAQLSGLFSLLALALPGCGGDAATGPNGEGCVGGGKCDEADGTVEITCLKDHTGLNKNSFELGDPVAKLLYADGNCEQGFEDTVTALMDSGKCENHRTMAVSEIAQRIDDKPPFFRTVTAMECELGEDKNGDTLFGGVWFSLFAAPDATSFDNAEIIAMDPVNGIFNYYDTSSGGVEFFGDSMQFIQDKRSAAQAAGSSEARCGGCHRGGGLIMKELPAPWMHWEPDFFSPGHSELIENNEELMGFVSDGIDLETDVVRPNNRVWNRSRISKVVNGLGTTTDMKLLLRPLFCTEDINLASNFGDRVSSGQLGGGIMVDRTISGFTSVSISQDDYDNIKAEFKQKMSSQLGSFDDTVGSLARVFRGASDVNYQDQLRGVNITKPDGSTEDISIVDQEFIEDVLMVDFTRALQFDGDDRCELLEFAPDLEADELNPDAVRKGFIANLEGASSPAAKDFLSYLQDDKDDTEATVRAFENACNDRDDEAEANGETVSGMAKDYLSVLFHNRNRAEDEPMFEFDGMTMPQTDSFSKGTRLDPNTCQLTTSYVSPVVVEQSEPDPGRGGSGGGDSDSCVDRCGEFDEDAECQCDEECLENDDCCDDFQDECPDVTGTLSCEFRCGEFNDDVSCQCDFECDDRGDCCFDWGDECMDPGNIDPGPAPDPKLSCEGRCGTFNPSENCQCNDICVDAGDCCPDFALECGGDVPEPEPVDNCIHVAEVLYDVAGADDGAEWIKLYNACDGEQDLKGMSVGYGGKNYTSGGFDLSGTIDAKSCIIVGGPASDGDNGEPNVTIELNFRPDLQNSGSEADGIAIFSGPFDDVTNLSVPVDAVIYGGSNSNDLLDARGETPDPHVADAPEGSTILRTGRDSWTVSEPDPTRCPDF